MTSLLILALWSIAALIYMVPTIVAFRRNHPNRWLILALNLAFGGTVFGWVICIVWACQAIHLTDDPEGSDGGESGLNLFVNDIQRVRVEAGDTQPPPQVPPIPSQELFEIILEHRAISMQHIRST